MSVVRRLRAVAILGGMWAIAWGLVGVGFAAWRVLLMPPPVRAAVHFWTRLVMMGGLLFAWFGFTAGVLFAVSLAKTTRTHSVDGFSLARAALWGALAGAAPVIVLSLTTPASRAVLYIGGAIGAVFGATTATLTVGAARRPLAGG